MKKVILATIIVFTASFISAQSYNPYVSQCMISPLLTWQLNGANVASFNAGNAGFLPLPLIRHQEVQIKITLSDGMPDIDPLNSQTALTVIGGTWAKMFNWSYNMLTSTYTGIQNQVVPGQSSGSYSKGEVEDYQVQVEKSTIGIDEKEGNHRLVIYSYENDIYVKDLTGRELKGNMLVYNLVGQRVAKKALTGGILNRFSMNVEEGYYVVEVVEDDQTCHGKVYLTR